MRRLSFAIGNWHLKCERPRQGHARQFPKKMLAEIFEPIHFFTVDVEEYFQVRALRSVVSRDEWLTRPSRVAKNIDDLLGCLDRHGVRGTFFLLGWIARYHPEVARS